MRARVAVGVAVLALVALPLLAQPVATERLGAGSLALEAKVDFDQATLRIAGPQGYELRKRFEAGSPISLDLVARPVETEVRGLTAPDAGGRRPLGLPDGRYKYEARFLREGSVSEVVSGLFFVEGGIAISRQAKQAQFGELRGDLIREDRVSRESLAASDVAPGFEVAGESSIEAYVANDYIVIVDVVNDGKTVLLMDSDSPVANEYFSVVNLGGDLQFSEDDAQAGGETPRVTFERGGDVGIGTTAPAVDLHIAGGGDIRSETSAATWQLQNGGDWAINLIDDGAGTSVNFVLNLEDDEAPGQWVRGLGIFEPDPLARLHVNSPGHDGTAKILVTEENGTVTGRTLFELQNNGNVQFFFQNTDSGDLWQMSQLSTVFQISSPSGSGKFRVRKGAGLQALNGSTTILDLNATGDLTVKSVTQTSSREEKLGFESVDGLSVLDKVAALPISEWSYKADNPSVRHIGPMSEDFHATFGLGKSDKGLTTVDTTGVALAAIQGLNQKLMAKNAELEQRIADLEEMVQALAEH